MQHAGLVLSALLLLQQQRLLLLLELAPALLLLLVAVGGGGGAVAVFLSHRKRKSPRADCYHTAVLLQQPRISVYQLHLHFLGVTFNSTDFQTFCLTPFLHAAAHSSIVFLLPCEKKKKKVKSSKHSFILIPCHFVISPVAL